MKRFWATSGWRAGAAAGALLLAAALAGPATAANTNLTATAQYSASSAWQEDQGNTTFVAAKAFDGDLTTRWNSYAGMAEGEWLAARWAQPVTVNKVVVRQAFDRITGLRVQRFDTTANDWVDVVVAEDEKFASVVGGDPANPTFTIRFPAPVETTGIRTLFTQVKSTSLSIFEVEAWNNPAGTLTGTVTDPAGKPIAGVVVRAGTDQAATNAEGKYTLVADAGTYNVTAGKPGAFRDRIARGVDVPANGTATRDFTLLPVPPNLARTATAVSSSDYQGGTNYDAAKANDGSLSTRWNSDGGDTNGAFLEMQWEQPQTFNKVTIREHLDRIRTYSLQRYDEANDAYVDIPGAKDVNVPTGSGDRTLSHIFAEPVTSKRLRLAITVADNLPTVWELEVANAPVATAKIVVKDVATGNPVPKAAVTSDLGVFLGVTNDKGELSLLVEPDDYVLSATAEGYFGGTPVSFTLNPGENREVTLTAPPTGPNIALTAKAAASTEVESAANANDGDLQTFWLAEETTNQWIAMTWEKPTRFTAVQLRGFQNTIQRSFLEIRDANGNWVEVPNTTINPEFLAIAGKPADFFFPQGITTTGVRYFVTATNSATAAPGLAEFLVYDSPIPQSAP